MSFESDNEDYHYAKVKKKLLRESAKEEEVDFKRVAKKKLADSPYWAINPEGKILK